MPPVEISCRRVRLQLARPFAISRSSVEHEWVLEVRLVADGVVGIGEGAPVDYEGQTIDEMKRFVDDAAHELVRGDLWAIADIADRLLEADGPSGAKMAIDGAVHDWIGKRAGLALWRLLGTHPRTPPTSMTLGLGDLDETVRATTDAATFEVLKVKLDGSDDERRLRAIREHSSARLRVDPNGAWSLDQALEAGPLLRELGVEVLEQPFHWSDGAAYERLKRFEDRPPVFVDESVSTLETVVPAARLADGINIKLAKSGGIYEARRMIHAARALGLEVMLGCMIESELGIAQAAPLASLVDHVDLDGHLLLASSPWTGLGFSDGRVELSERPGLGVRASHSA